MSTRYTAEDHRKAFETWYETRNMAEVASSLGANYLTPRRWRDADFNCSWSCPYHDWDKLMDERDAALHARAQLVNGGNVDPIAHEKAMRELDRLGIMPPMSPETGIIRTYLDWILDLPWKETTEDNLDIECAKRELEDSHYGLKDAKERILEHIAVRNLAADRMRLVER